MEFIAQASTAGLDSIVAGYLEAAEFSCMEESEQRQLIRGWTRDAVAQATREVALFLAHANPADIEYYRENYTPRGEYDIDTCIGHDLCYTASGAGVGFWDRDLGDVGDRLTDAAKQCRTVDVLRGRTGWLSLY